MLSVSVCLLLILTACTTGTTNPTTETITGIVATSTVATSTPFTTPTITVTTAPTTTPTGADMVEDVKGRLVEKPKYGGTLVYRAADGNFGEWDPLMANGNIQTTMGCIYDILSGGDWSVDRSVNNYKSSFVDFFKYGKGYMMESWESPDQLTYIIHLRQGMLWQNKPPVNGREVTATDVKYSLDRDLNLGDFQKARKPAFQYNNWSALKEVEVLNKYTLVFHMKTFNAVFPNMWGCEVMPGIIPREVVDTYGDGFKWNQAVGSGPWQVTDYVLDSSLVFARNPTYYGVDDNFPENHIPYADKLRVLVIPDWSTTIAALRTGKISQLGVGYDDYATLIKSNPDLRWSMSKTTASALEINNSKVPYNDIRVRKAMQMSINLKEINDTFVNGLGDTFPSMVSPDFTDLYTKFEDYPKDVQEGFTYDPAGAKALLAEAGYPNGFSQVMPLTGQNNGADMVINYFAAIGIKTEQRILDGASYAALIYSGNQQMMWLWTYGNWMPLEILNYWYGGQKQVPWNFGNVNDPVFNQMLEDILAEPNADKRLALEKAAFVYGTSQFYYIAMPSGVGFNFWQPWYKGYQGENRLTGGQVGSIGARVWLDQDLKFKLTGSRN